jgi:hypothetical protein
MGISRHIAMQDLPPVVADDEKAVQNTERERWDSEEVVWSKNSNGLRWHNLRFPRFSSNRFR